MWKLLERIGIHRHKWKIIKATKLSIVDDDEKTIGTEHIYTLQCIHCGDIKFKRNKL